MQYLYIKFDSQDIANYFLKTNDILNNYDLCLLEDNENFRKNPDYYEAVIENNIIVDIQEREDLEGYIEYLQNIS